MPKKKIRISLISAQFHEDIVERMIHEATEELKKMSGVLSTITRVTGCFEIPLAVKRVMLKKTIDAVVVLGFIEKGETLHGEVMGHVVYQALMDIQLEYMKPIGFGIIGPGASEKQARVRMVGTARHAVQAAFSQYQT